MKQGKPFAVFSQLVDDRDEDVLSKTWKVASKVANELEHGHRIENLSWRMWHLQDVIGSTSVKVSYRSLVIYCIADKRLCAWFYHANISLLSAIFRHEQTPHFTPLASPWHIDWNQIRKYQ